MTVFRTFARTTKGPAAITTISRRILAATRQTLVGCVVGCHGLSRGVTFDVNLVVSPRV